MNTSVMERIQENIDAAEMVLVGLGEEWNETGILHSSPVYRKGTQLLAKMEAEWVEPAWSDFCRNKLCSKTEQALQTLCGMLGDKNYFVVSISTNGRIERIPWREGRLVMPCGSSGIKQCSSACEAAVEPISAAEATAIDTFMIQLWNELEKNSEEDCDKIENVIKPMLSFLQNQLGCCDKCGTQWKFNSIYTDDYKEAGYLDQWVIYRKWLQGTVNRKLLILELGVGMKFPSVIRFPFEKVAFYNQKSTFVRIHEKLYQLTPELAEKGISIAENVVDCFASLC